MKHPIGSTKNDYLVFVDLIHSQAAKKISAQPQLLMLIKEAIKSHSPSKNIVEIEHDMGRSVGYDFTIEISEKDTVFFAKLLKASTFTPFVKNGAPLNTSSLSIVLGKSETNEYMLMDAWIGSMSPALPGSDNETSDSKTYWTNHAVVYTNQAIQTSSLTKVSPY